LAEIYLGRACSSPELLRLDTARQGTSRVPGVQGTGKQIEIKIFGSEGMLCYGGDDADPSSGELALTALDGVHCATGAGGDDGIAKMWNRREISASS
jgi:hypothetical protein